MIYDISQEILSCTVYPGDPAPQMTRLKRMEDGELYNLSASSMCAHNGTHIDAPAHFLADGKTVEQLDLSVCIGRCYVCRHTGHLSAEDAETVCTAAEAVGGGERILMSGGTIVTEDAAEVFLQHGVQLRFRLFDAQALPCALQPQLLPQHPHARSLQELLPESFSFGTKRYVSHAIWYTRQMR